MKPYQFKPLQNFNTSENSYLVGLTYTVRGGEKRLHAAVQQWLAEKKVELVADGD